MILAAHANPAGSGWTEQHREVVRRCYRSAPGWSAAEERPDELDGRGAFARVCSARPDAA